LAAPFPYFGGKALAAGTVWAAFGEVRNYVEPFCGSAAMLLSRPGAAPWGVETVNDADGFVVNFWRAVARDSESVAVAADWPVTEADLEARHAWLVNRAERLRWQLEDPEFYDAKIAGWWVWGACAWIGDRWCSGDGPHLTTGARLYDRRQLPHLGPGRGINRKQPHLGPGRGINRKEPRLGPGRGINRQLPHLGAGRGITSRRAFIEEWFGALSARLRDVRVACGDWQRVLTPSVTTLLGVTAVFLDPPYTKAAMNYAVGGLKGELADAVRQWCHQHGADNKLRIVLCGHAGEHDALLRAGWRVATWRAHKGYASTAAARANVAAETLWLSPHCRAIDAAAARP
jgi:site-specific DNA-adenine methylase